ncbi:glycosyltransferase family A protein [Salimicrobium sp. PL1-032A]|uniref:glycosyltransferase n=1 Tax=Salimicrobium sp. PL1-032A TaxID=3095364 RepID=UPI00326113EA
MSSKTGIVFSTYNSAAYVKECLVSCIYQDHHDVEIVVVDDGSEDHTSEVIRKYAGLSERVHFIQLPHGERGIARKTAINKALELEVDYLFIIDSDMMLEKTLVSKCVSYLSDSKTGALVIPEVAYSSYDNLFSRVKVFERNLYHIDDPEIDANSIEAARFWKVSEYLKTGGINVKQISFEEIQPTIRYVEMGGTVERATFTAVYHDEKYVSFKELMKKKMYYFKVMPKTIASEKEGFKKALQRWYFFRPILYKKQNLKKYAAHPGLTGGLVFMYASLSVGGVVQLLKNRSKG